MLTERDDHMLLALARYVLLDRRRLQRLCFPLDPTGRITRRRIFALLRERMIQRTRLEVVNPKDGMPAPAYFLADAGRRRLAELSADDRYLALPISFPQPLHLHHMLAVADTHITLDQAIAAQSAEAERVELVRWVSEFHVLNAEERNSAKRVRLLTELKREPRRLFFAPDAAFVLRFAGHVGVFYLEQDRGTSGARQVASRKTPATAEFARKQLHRQHFPETTLDRFTVLCIAPNASRRDALRRAFQGTDRAEIWRFAAVPDLIPDTLLFGNVLLPHDISDRTPLVRRPTCRDQSSLPAHGHFIDHVRTPLADAASCPHVR